MLVSSKLTLKFFAIQFSRKYLYFKTPTAQQIEHIGVVSSNGYPPDRILYKLKMTVTLLFNLFKKEKSNDYSQSSQCVSGMI